MGTMIQYYTAPTEERAWKLHHDICQALQGSTAFEEDDLVVEAVGPIVDVMTQEVSHYGFGVYFDTVDVEGTNVHFQEERRAMSHARGSYKLRKKGDVRFIRQGHLLPSSYLPGEIHE